jgi:single-strand DNA-binding protein
VLEEWTKECEGCGATLEHFNSPTLQQFLTENQRIMNTLRNKVQLIGNLGNAPEVKTLETGNTLAKMRIATSEIYKNAAGEKVTTTQWHTVIAWGKIAEIAGRYLTKGSEVMIEGRLTYREYTTSDGQKRTATEIVANDLMLMGKKPAEAAAA